MKDGAQEILGKTILGVVIKASDTGAPRSQLFLVFTDGTSYEFYCDSAPIRPTGGIWPGGIEEVRNYMANKMKIVFEACAGTV